MRCERCQGHFAQGTYPPCPDCNGSGIVSCCEVTNVSETSEMPNDYPLNDCAKQVSKLLTMARVPTRVHQKWTCPNCSSRQTMSTPNNFFTSGHCEACDHTSPITHCNYLLVIGKDPMI